MLEGLFDEEASQFEAKQSTSSCSGGKRLSRPSAPRNNTGLCGLSNLGATCYLNSLLQTLHFTPEFREELFKLTENELGVFEDGGDNSMVRVIPIQLQKLFADLLLLNQQSSSVDALTNSFGWNSSEEFQQHDVQELNRILFSAIESSLLGTSGEHLIAKLYHGISVQQITCQNCSRVSEREEEYLDIPVALSARPNLESVLKDTYIEQELLEGANQYRCESCQKLVDAKRGCHIRKLPPILTFALLRFLYDFERGERYKDTSRFKFPFELDMSPYCEPDSVKGGTIYELFSVVIHSGSTHSGHYTAYIRDIDRLGTWTPPGEEIVQLPSDPTSGSVDLIDFDNPADLIVELLKQMGGGASISKLTKALQEKTGVTWNKRFKKQFGPIGKFLKTCPDLFSVNETNQVSLTQSPVVSPHPHTQTASPTINSTIEKDAGKDDSPLIVSVNMEQASSPLSGSSPSTSPKTLLDNTGLEEDMDTTCVDSSATDRVDMPVDSEVAMAVDGSVDQRGDEEEAGKGGDGKKAKISMKKDSKSPPPHGHCWFEFNDTYVSSIVAKEIDKMYQGKQSAYMLFYRRKSMERPLESRGNLLYGVPDRFQMDVATANATLDEERYQYDIAVNTVQVNINFSLEFMFSNGSLQRIADTEPCVLSIDRRKTVADLKEDITKAFPDMFDTDNVVIHTAKSLPAGMHLYNCVSDNDTTVLTEAGLTDDCHVFVWDGQAVSGETIQVGGSCEPIVLHVTYPSPSEDKDMECELVTGFPKNSTLGEVRSSLSHLLDIQTGQVSVSQVKISERNGQSSIIVLSASKDNNTLEELKLGDGDRLAVERNIKKGVKSLAHSVADKHSKMLSVIIENRLMPFSDPSASYPVFPVELGKDDLVSTLKTTALSFISTQEYKGACRLRGDDDVSGLGPPLYETQTLTEAGVVPGQRLILECGLAPLSNQVALQCMVSTDSPSVSGEVCEVILGRSVTVRECRCAMVEAVGLTGCEWHLRRTNWCGEASEILEDEEATLEQERIKSGDLLLIEEGRLPPKGFIRLHVYLHYITPSHSNESISYNSEELRDTAHVTGEQALESPKEVPLHLIPPSQYYPPVPGEIVEVGGLEISKDATVEYLKSMILTLPAFENARAPLSGFLRVRELVNGRPGKIFKLHSHTMRRLKLSSGSKVCCTVLSHEEELSTTTVVFNLCMRIPGEKTYGPHTEVIYDTAQSTSPHALRVHVSQLWDIPLDRLRMAKHKMESFEWIRIQDSYQSDSSKRGRKKAQGSKVNIRNSPIILKDGDTIGVKDLQYDPDDSDDFSTAMDDRGRAVLTAVQEDKRQRRKAKGNSDVLSEGSSGSRSARQRRQEVGIKIFVPDFGANSKQSRDQT